MLVVIAAAACICLSACQSNPAVKSSSKQGDDAKRRTAAIQRVKVGAEGAVLGDASARAMSTGDLVRRTDRLLSERRLQSARLLVRDYPDVALELLRQAGPQGADSQTLRFIANAYDDYFLVGQAQQGWSATLQKVPGSVSTLTAFLKQRQTLVDHLQHGRFTEAALVRLPAIGDTSFRQLEIDGGHLAGMASLLANRRREAAERFEKAGGLAREVDRYHAAAILLLAGESYQRLGDKRKAAETWKTAVGLAAIAMVDGKVVPDPILWQRAIEMKPAGADWPASVEKAFVQVNGGVNEPSARPAVTAHVWEQIGKWRLDRHEPQPALLALRNAQTLARSRLEIDRLQVAQCQALVQLSQSSAAKVNLLRLVETGDPQTRRSALALLGVIELRRNNAATGLGLLKKAVESEDGSIWPGAMDAKADLGLAYLITGDEEQGLRWIHEAQERFRKTQAYGKLIQSLRNELAYFESKGEKAKAQQVRQTLEETEQG